MNSNLVGRMRGHKRLWLIVVATAVVEGLNIALRIIYDQADVPVLTVMISALSIQILLLWNNRSVAALVVHSWRVVLCLLVLMINLIHVLSFEWLPIHLDAICSQCSAGGSLLMTTAECTSVCQSAAARQTWLEWSQYSAYLSSGTVGTNLILVLSSRYLLDMQK